MDVERIVEKIKKCLALSESSNENEAKVAAEMAAEMMEKYKISQAELHVDPNAVNIEVIEQPMFSGKGLWHTLVARHVAYATDCKLYVKNRKMLTIVGTASSIEIATYLYQYLTRMLRHLARFYCLEFHGTKNPGATVRYSFLEGCADGVGQRLREKRDSVRNAARATGTNCTALLVLDKEVAAVDSYMASLGLGRGRRRPGHGDGVAYMHGQTAGRQVQLRDAVKSGSSRSPKQLGR